MRVLVVGAGNIGRYLALDLAERGHDVTVVDEDAAALRPFPEPKVVVSRGDGCAPPVLRAAGAREAEVLVAATGDDEDNLVISLLAKQEFGVPRVMARVNHPINDWLFDEHWGVDVAVSPPHLLTALVEEEVTAGDLVPLLKLQRGEVQLLEVRLDDRSEAVGRRVGELELPEGCVLVAAVREGRVVPCRETTPLAEGDEVLALVDAGSETERRLRRELVGDDG